MTANPHHGGSYVLDQKSGELTRMEFTAQAGEQAPEAAQPTPVASSTETAKPSSAKPEKGKPLAQTEGEG